MNRSTVYGCTAMVVAGLGGYFVIKGRLDERRRDPTFRASRLGQSTTSKATDPEPGRTPLNTSSPGVKASPKMESNPTGVDTSEHSAMSQQDR